MRTFSRLFTSLFIIALSSMFTLQAQGLRIISVNPFTDEIAIKNYGGTTIDISTYRFCSLFAYTPSISAGTTILSGSYNLAPGDTVVMNGFALNNAAADLGLYMPTGLFSSSSAMVDFVQWGSGGNGRESVAVAKGIWTTGTFINYFGTGSMLYVGDGIQVGVGFWSMAWTVYINELHYDDDAADAAEGVEIAGVAGTDLACYRLVFYDGGDSLIYNSNPIVNLTGTIPNLSCGYGTVWFPIAGIQNGPRDAICLYDTCSATIVQFISYEGGIIALDNIAIGMSSMDIGVAETPSTPNGESLQLIGSGAVYTDFTWASPMNATPDQVNTGQLYCVGDTIISFVGSGVTVLEDTGTVTIELSIINPSPTTAFTVDVAYSTGSATNVADFTFATQTITFPANDSTNKTATITIVDDTIAENSESIVLILQNASAGINFGSDSVFTVTIAPNDVILTPCSDLFISEYVEGTSNNKALELYNPRTNTVDLSNYTLSKRTNGTGSINSYTFTGMLAPDSVFVIVHSSADPSLQLLADTITGGVTGFNGNDPIILVNTLTGDTIDNFGEWGVDPGTNWPVGSGATSENTLVRMASVQQGNLYWTGGATEWDVFAQDDWTHLGSHTMTACAVPMATANFSSTSPVCIGDSVCFTDLSTAGGGAIASWSWDFGDGSGTSTSQNPCYTYSTDGSYSVKLIVTDDSSNVDSISINIAVDAAATVSAGSNDTICAGDGLNLGGSIGGLASSSIWTTGGDGTFPDSSQLNSSYTAGTADMSGGTVTLYLTTDNPAGTCNAVMDSMILVINQLATVAAGADQTICIADPIAVNGAIGGSATSSAWITLGDGSFADSSLLVTTYTTGPTDNGMGFVTLVLLSDNPTGPCGSVSDTMVVSIAAEIIVDAGIDQIICADMSCTSLSGSVTGSTTTGIWTTTGLGAFSPNDSDLNACYTASASDTAAGSVMLILTSTNNGVCSADADTVILTINPLPSLAGSAVIDSSTCGNSDGNVTGITASGVATLTYSWVNSVPAVVGSAADLLLIPSDCYTLSVIDGNGCVATSGPHCVIDAGTPGVPTGAGGATYCSGDVIADLTATGSGGTLYWFNDAILTDTAGSGSPFASGATTTDTFYVAELGACLGLGDMVIITVNDKPVPAFATANVCDGDTANFTDMSTIASGSIASWMWDFGDAATSTQQSPNHAYSTAGSYTVQLIATSSDGCTDSVTMSIDVHAMPAVSFTASSACLGTATIFTNTSTISSGAIASWAWSFGDGNVSSSQDPSNAYATSGSFMASLIATSDSGCVAEDSVAVTVLGATTVDAGADITTCNDGNCVVITGSVSGNSSTGIWTSLGTGTMPNDSDLVNCYTLGASDIFIGSVMLILTSTNNGACAAVADTVTITTVPGVSVNAGIDQAVCGTGCVTLTGSVSGSSTTGMWVTTGSGTFTPNDSDLAACYNPSSADTVLGSVTLVLSSTNNGLCSVVMDTVILTFSQDATANAGADAPICGGTSVVLGGSISGASGAIWTTSGDGSFDDDSLLNATYTPGAADIAAGTVTLTLTTEDPAGACTAGTDDVVLTLAPAPVADFVSTATNFTVIFVDNTTIAAPAAIASWLWDFGDGNSSISQGPSNTYTANGSYTACLTATSTDGCADTFCDTVTVVGVGISEINLEELIKVFPNPTADGVINITVSGEAFNGAKLRILNLYGQLIVERTINSQGLEVVNLSKQAAGIYVISISTAEGNVTKRVTVF